jgi:oligoribonuclease NrnB/cAMP/cGMP phosphodiesterase (DHH superfamily)
MTARLIIYHHPCPDGYIAMLIAKRASESKGVSYATHRWDWDTSKLPSFKNYRTIFFLDCAPRLDVLISAARANPETKFVVMDHHRTTVNQYIGIGNMPGRVKLIINESMAGCQLAWDYFHAREARPWYVEAVADRDLWTFKIPTSKAINRAFKFFPPPENEPDISLDVLDRFSENEVADLAVKGTALLAEDATLIAKFVAQAHPVRFTPPTGSDVGPSDGMLWEAPEDYDHLAHGHLISDVGNVLSNNTGFSVQVWRDGGLSFRSSKTSPVVQRVDLIANFFGGGGHPNAAGAKTGKTFEFPGSLLIAYPDLFKTR